MANPFKEFQEAEPETASDALLTHHEASPDTEVEHHGFFRSRFEKAHEQLYDDVVKVFEDELLRLVRERPDLVKFTVAWGQLLKLGHNLPALLTRSLIDHMIDHFSKEGFDVTPELGQFTYTFTVLPYESK